jgi:hypothetical protein
MGQIKAVHMYPFIRIRYDTVQSSTFPVSPWPSYFEGGSGQWADQAASLS